MFCFQGCASDSFDLRLEMARATWRLYPPHGERKRRKINVWKKSSQAKFGFVPLNRHARGNEEEGGGEIPGPGLFFSEHGAGKK